MAVIQPVYPFSARYPRRSIGRTSLFGESALKSWKDVCTKSRLPTDRKFLPSFTKQLILSGDWEITPQGCVRQCVRMLDSGYCASYGPDQYNRSTRWASNGIISLANSHPADGSLYGKEHAATMNDREARFVLNGDVDNYNRLVQEFVHGQDVASIPR